MKSTIIIDGGLGRQITAIPALEKFVSKNPDTTIISHFWTAVYYGNKLLSDITFDVNTKGLFDRIKDTKIIKPEPYHNTNYINERISLADAFNEEINGDNEKMPVPRIHLSPSELKIGKTNTRTSNKKVVCFQPFGSTAIFSKDDVLDTSARSLSKEATIRIIQRLRGEGIDIAFFDNRDVPFLDRNQFLPINRIDYREWAAVIANCDYFIGADSSGQHIARSFDLPGTVIVGGTNVTNVTYPEHFTIISKKGIKKFMCMRLCEFDYKLAELQNGDTMEFTMEQIDEICDIAIKEIKKGPNDKKSKV